MFGCNLFIPPLNKTVSPSRGLGDLYLTILETFDPDLRFLACTISLVFCLWFCIFFHKICEVFESLYSLSQHHGMLRQILFEWLNNIVRGRLVYQMSAAMESKNEMINAVAPNLVKSISI